MPVCPDGNTLTPESAQGWRRIGFEELAQEHHGAVGAGRPGPIGAPAVTSTNCVSDPTGRPRFAVPVASRSGCRQSSGLRRYDLYRRYFESERVVIDGGVQVESSGFFAILAPGGCQFKGEMFIGPCPSSSHRG